MKKIVIDPGHGGIDPGTSGNGIIEKDFNLEISKYMNDRFKELGFDSSITRDNDITLSPSVRPGKVKSFYGSGSDVIVISNHVNSGGGDGAEIIYALRNNDELSKRIAKEFEQSGQNVRKYYQRRLPSNISKDYYYLLRDTPNNETIIVEYGFIDSSGNDVDLLKNSWKDLAEAVIKAVASYANVEYKLPQETGYYVVKPGDTLWSIAKQKNISVDAIKELNNLSSNLLKVGQKLLLKNTDDFLNNTYVVQKGDTLYSIANKYNTSVEDLKTINGLTSNILQVGQTIIIKSDKQDINYTAKEGDTLWKIASTYNVTVDELKKINNLTNNTLSIGQVLKIPHNYKIYIVKEGDTLYKIARENNTTVSDIKNINNLLTDTLSVGQKLLIV